VRFVVADHRLEPALRRLTGAEALPGWIRLRYGREPDFFQGLGVQGTFTQAFACLGDEEQLLGVGTRAVRPAWLDGEPGSVGYLGGLRVSRDARGGTILARGYRMLRELHGDRRCDFYLTTILEENTAALALLTSRRAGLPHYLDAGRLYCHVVSPRALADVRGAAADCRVQGGGEIGRERLFAFLAAAGRERQFFPILRPDDLGGPLLRGLCQDDFLVATSPGGDIVGCIALWDQSGFKQFTVEGYSPGVGLTLSLLRPLTRLGLGIELPLPGEELRLLNLALPCVRGNDRGVLAALLQAAGRRAAGGDHHGVLFGFHEADPLRPGRIPGFTYASRVFLVCWDEELPAAHRALAGERPLHLDAASL